MCFSGKTEENANNDLDPNQNCIVIEPVEEDWSVTAGNCNDGEHETLATPPEDMSTDTAEGDWIGSDDGAHKECPPPKKKYRAEAKLIDKSNNFNIANYSIAVIAYQFKYTSKCE